MSDPKGRGNGESSTPEAQELDAVAKRLRDIQRRKRGHIRWSVSRQTAERAIEAIRLDEEKPAYRRSAKSRRRKRSKRLL